MNSWTALPSTPATGNRAGNRTARAIRSEQLDGQWMISWCHLRATAREFTVTDIDSVSVPAP